MGIGGGKVEAIVGGFISNIVFAKSKVLGSIYSFASAFSSAGGIVALVLDLSDRKPDDYFTIKY